MTVDKVKHKKTYIWLIKTEINKNKCKLDPFSIIPDQERTQNSIAFQERAMEGRESLRDFYLKK